MHPAMTRRLLAMDKSQFKGGVNGYTPTVGEKEANEAVLHIISSSGCETKHLFSQITDGGSQAMELAILGCCGAAGSKDRPLLVIEPVYTNYVLFARRLGRHVVPISRTLQDDGSFTLPPIEEIERTIVEHKPGALVVIPYDNPTGQLYARSHLVELARLCARHGIWLISDEAYRELCYSGPAVSVWGITERDAPGITGKRISIESSSKVWNACGLRIGALVTDNKLFHEKAVAENTASLSPNAIGQYLFAALKDESPDALRAWYTQQRAYYQDMMRDLRDGLRKSMPGIIVSRPDAALYSIVDVRAIAPDFDATDFVMFCARHGKVDVGGEACTLLVSPMEGFYMEPGAGRTQMRLAYVPPPDEIALVPELFAKLFAQYHEKKSAEARRAGSTG
jgi:aspartate aminotransferase